MTKSSFKKECFSNTYTGYNGNKIRINAFYFDWKQFIPVDRKDINESFQGYKFMGYADTRNCSKKELFDAFYDWINSEGKINLPPYILYKYAATDKERFKVKLSI